MTNSSEELEEPIENEEEEGEIKIPHSESHFKQQKVAACKPFLTPILSALIYFVMAIICFAIGAVYQLESENMKEKIIDYTDLALNSLQTIEFKLDEDFNGNIFLFYEIDNLYQNQYAYINSKNIKQLEGGKRKDLDLSSCEPREKEGEKAYAPCGSIASSVFNDTFQFQEDIKIDDSDISLDYYQKHYKKLNTEDWNSENSVFVLDEELFPGDVSNPHFQTWMQVAPIGTVRKPWGKITSKMPKGTYHIDINNNYPVSSFKGKKKVIISEVKWFGTKNKFFPIFFLVIGGLSLFTSITFLVLYLLHQLPLYKNIQKEISQSTLLP